MMSKLDELLNEWDAPPAEKRKGVVAWAEDAPAEPPCCRAARERVAELEKRPTAEQLYSRVVTWAQDASREEVGELARHGRAFDLSCTKRIADLEAKLAEALEENRALVQENEEASRSFERLSAAFAERDKLRAELKANAERLDTWRGQSADIRGALDLPHDAEWETVFQTAKEAKRSLALWQNAYRTHFSPQHDETKHPNEWPEVARVTVEKLRAEVERLSAFEGDSQVLTEVVGLLELDDEAVSEDIYTAISDLQQAAITLPTDTTTPLDLAQRAVALMGGRELLVVRSHDTVPIRCKARESGELCALDGVGRWVRTSWGLAMLTCNKVTLAPEPEPERRKLTFGEACLVECPEGQAVLEVAMVKRDNQRWILERYSRGHIRFHVHTSTASWFADFAPWMLAAKWEACS